ncbi:MAG TPA: hypothetical protein VIF57_00480 [Polyangia bacterium]
MKRGGLWSVGIAVLAMISATAWADGLAGLDATLRATGRVGTPAPQAAGGLPATTPDAGAPERARDPRQALVRIEDAAAAQAAAATTTTPTAADEEELQRTDGAVVACRVEVARRRRVPPAKVAAGSVVVRFTIEKSGRVREAEALSALDTDLEVAACAKRVLSQWTFAKRARDALVVERTYRFTRS